MRIIKTGKINLGGIRKSWLLSFMVIMVIPVAGLIIIFLHTRTVITREIVQSSLTINKSIQTAIDARFHNGNQISSGIIMDKRFRNILLKKNSWQDIVMQQEELVKYLKSFKITNPGTDILVYVPELRYIFTGETANWIDRLYDALNYLGFDNIKQNEWDHFLIEAGSKTQYISSPYLSYNAFGRQALAYCTNTNQPIFSNCYSTNIIITMQYDDMAKMFEDQGDSTILILDNYGNTIHSFGTELQNIQINLEENINGYQIIKNLGNEYVCTFRKSEIGPFAYAVLTRQASFWNLYNTVERITIIVIVAALLLDLGMALSLLQINYRPVRSVLNTLNITNSQAKNESNRGNEFDIIKEQVLSLANARNKFENDLLEQDRFLRETVLNTALTRSRQYFSNDDLMESIGLDHPGCLLIPVSILPVNFEQSSLAGTLKTPYTEITISMILDNTLSELTGNTFHFYRTAVEQTTVFIFFINNADSSSFYQNIQNIMEEMCSLFNKKYSLVLDVVIGNEAPSLDMLFPRYQEIRTAHMIGVISGEHRVMRPPVTRNPGGNGSILTDDYVQLLSEAIEHHSWNEVNKIAGDYFLRLENNKYPFYIFRYYVFSLVSMLIDLLPHPVSEINGPVLKDILDSTAADNTQAQLRHNFDRFIRLFYPEPRKDDRENFGIFTRIDSFIMVHYNDINLSLTMIADNVGLSVKYLSKLFKMETGQGLLNYIGSIRVKKAKELLIEKNYSLEKIAVMVGYSSVKTFRRVFQKIEGINPSEFRSGKQL